jgi:hypothetical protein
VARDSLTTASEFSVGTPAHPGNMVPIVFVEVIAISAKAIRNFAELHLQKITAACYQSP